MINIKPEIKKRCNLIEALEYLGLEWKPFVANDERLLSQERCRVPFDGERKSYCIEIKRGTSYRINYTDAEQNYICQMYKAVAALENLIRTKKIQFTYGKYKIVEDIFINTPPTVEYMLDNIEDVFICFNDRSLSHYASEFIMAPAVIITNSMGEVAFSAVYFDFSKLKNAVTPNTDILEYVKDETHANLFTVPENLNSPDLLVLMEALKRGIYIDKNYKTSNYNSKKKLINDLIAIYDEMSFPYSDKILNAMGTILADLSFRNKNNPNQK